MLMILCSQSKAWYAAQPEDNLVQDVARKMALSLVLLIPNTAVLGVGVIIVVMGSWHTFTMVGYCFAGVCPILLIVCCCAFLMRRGDEDVTLFLVLLYFYTFLLAVMIWATVEANTNPGNYDHVFIITKGYFNPIAGIILGIAFLPVILMVLALGIVIIWGPLYIIFWVLYILVD